MSKTNPSQLKRARRKCHIRKDVSGTQERPRLSVFRSAKHIYAQIIDDVQGTTLLAVSTLDAEVKAGVTYGGNKKAATVVGTVLGNRAKEAGISLVVFDRNGYLYHGRVQALADAARKAGLDF